MNDAEAWQHYPELLARPVPRYTSFPTAAEFGDGVNGADFLEQLDAVADGTEVSLYLHIPFCRQLCWYCGCNTGAANRPSRLQTYLRSLEREIAMVGRRIGSRVRVSRIAWGGGSPDAVRPAEFVALSSMLDDHFDTATATRSVEVDPRDLSAGWSDALTAASVTRASLGVQTFEPRIQERIGRVQPLEMVCDAVANLRRAGVTSMNFDLMYGLPGQAISDLTATINETIALGPERVAVFGYAHVPHLVRRQRLIDAANLPGPEARFAQAMVAHDQLAAAGYLAVGFDHFAKPQDALAVAAKSGLMRRNFQGFTEDQAPVLIGFGASAISSFPNAILQNEKNVGRYQMRVSAGVSATARGVKRSVLDQLRGRCIESLLCDGQADLGDLPDLADIRLRIRPFEDRGLASWDGAKLEIAPSARPYARAVAAILDPYRAGPRMFSSAI